MLQWGIETNTYNHKQTLQLQLREAICWNKPCFISILVVSHTPQIKTIVHGKQKTINRNDGQPLQYCSAANCSSDWPSAAAIACCLTASTLAWSSCNKCHGVRAFKTYWWGEITGGMPTFRHSKHLYVATGAKHDHIIYHISMLHHQTTFRMCQETVA